ncbi:MAG TPA: sigma-70 family RNA polymerase sigma factor [Rhizomicrobium sp.]|nr:sigma-70 family RNA polymerase sigma factor [Rhizomicrobium sp.]
MAERPEINESGASGACMSASDLEAWFLREIFPLESILMHFLQQSWRNKSEIEDLRQEVYVRVYEAARKEVPAQPKAFLLRTARNLLINRVRREHVVPIEAVADLDALGAAIEVPGPDRNVIARDLLRRLQTALDRLPPRCREVVVLRRIEGLSRPEIAARMGISQDTVSEHLANGIAVLANTLYGDIAVLGERA